LPDQVLRRHELCMESSEKTNQTCSRRERVATHGALRPPPPGAYDTHTLVDPPRVKVHQTSTKLVADPQMAPRSLILLAKFSQIGLRAAAFLGLALALSTPGGCIMSSAPILGDARAILGDRIQIHAFTPTKDGGREHSAVVFEWSGSRYLPLSSVAEVADFTVHPYEGRDLIIQSRARRGVRPIQYAL